MELSRISMLQSGFEQQAFRIVINVVEAIQNI